MPFQADKDPIEVASPCIGVCQIEPVNGLCRGCYRSLDEIRRWPMLDTDGKWAMLSELKLRRVDAGVVGRQRGRRRDRTALRARVANADNYLVRTDLAETGAATGTATGDD